MRGVRRLATGGVFVVSVVASSPARGDEPATVDPATETPPEDRPPEVRPPEARPPPAPVDTVRVRARMANDRPGRLFLIGADGTEMLCALPCEATVARGARLRVVSGDKTDTFEIKRDALGEVAVTVDQESWVPLGIIVVSIGGAGTLFGLLHLAMNAGGKSGASSGDVGPGIAITLAGVALMAGGGYLLSMQDRITADPRYGQRPPPPPPPPRDARGPDGPARIDAAVQTSPNVVIPLPLGFTF